MRPHLHNMYFYNHQFPTILRDLLSHGPYKAIFSAADTAADQAVIGQVLAAQGGGEFLAAMRVKAGVELPRGSKRRVRAVSGRLLKEELWRVPSVDGQDGSRGRVGWYAKGIQPPERRRCEREEVGYLASYLILAVMSISDDQSGLT